MKILSFCSVLLLAVVSVHIAAAQVIPTFHTELLLYQKGSPIQIASVSTSTTFFFNGALLLNCSNSNVVEVQIGLVLKGHREGDHNQVAFMVDNGPRVGVAIRPGEAASIGVIPWRTAEILTRAMDFSLHHFAATFGIVGVKFDDGSSYQYDLGKNGDFSQDPQDPAAANAHRLLDKHAIEQFLEDAKSRAVQNQLRSRTAVLVQPSSGGPKPVVYRVNRFIPTPQGGPSFCCKNTTTKIYCTNNQTSCSVSFCGRDCLGTCHVNCECCACQVCSVSPDCG